MGSDLFYPEERPRRRVRVDPFWIDETPVTNSQFAKFVAETGHRTLAEIPPDPADYPGMLPHMASARALDDHPVVHVASAFVASSAANSPLLPIL